MLSENRKKIDSKEEKSLANRKKSTARGIDLKNFEITKPQNSGNIKTLLLLKFKSLFRSKLKFLY